MPSELCPFPKTNATGGGQPCDVTFAQYLGSEYRDHKISLLCLWGFLTLLSSQRLATLALMAKREHIKPFKRCSILLNWVCSMAALVYSIDPLSYSGTMPPVVGQFVWDLATSCLQVPPLPVRRHARRQKPDGHVCRHESPGPAAYRTPG